MVKLLQNRCVGIAIAILLSLTYAVSTYAQEFWVEGDDGRYNGYSVTSSVNLTCAIIGGDGVYASRERFVIPSSVDYNGKTYTVTSIGDKTFYRCSKLQTVEIPNTITSIGISAFYGCTSLNSIDIPNSVILIGNSAFSGCTNLVSVKLPDGITSIADFLFLECYSLKSMVIPNSVTSIGDQSFAMCRNLSSLVIGRSVRQIYRAAFFGCKSNIKTYVLPETPPSCPSQDIVWNENEFQNGILYVSQTTLDSYKSAKTWKDFKNIELGVKLSASEIEIIEDYTGVITATIPTDDDIAKTVVWTSSDNDVATVSSDGTVTGLRMGTATISAAILDDIVSTCKVTVVENVKKTAAKFRADNADILAKTADGVTADDLEAVGKALADYNVLSDKAKLELAEEKALLDAQKVTAEKDKAEREALKAEIAKFNADNAAVLSKAVNDITAKDLEAVNKALTDYEGLSDKAKAQLAEAKTLLDAAKAKAEEDALQTEIAKFNTDHTAILSKKADEATADDIEAIDKALEDYEALSDKAKAALAEKKTLLDAQKVAAEKDKADKEKEAAIVAEISKFNSDNAEILAKTAENVTSDDLDAIDKAIAEYGALSDEAQSRLANSKTLLDSMKAAAEKDKADKEAAEAAIVAEVNKFRTDNAGILAVAVDVVVAAHLEAIDAALADYNNLSPEAQARLTEEKDLLDALKVAAEQDKADKEAAEEAERLLQAEIATYKAENADILAKTADNATADDIDAIDKAIAEYYALSSAAQARLINVKALLDVMKVAAEQDKADKEAEAAIVAEVNAFNESNADILAKTADNATADDLDAIDKAIAEYYALSVEAQSRLSSAKAQLDAMKVAAEQDKADKEAEAAIVAEVNAFNESNANILAKTADNVTADDLDAIEKAIAEYNALSAEAQSRLSSAKAQLDAMKVAAEQDKADKEAEAAIVAEVNAFNESNADILAKTADNVTVDDLDAIDKAIAEYNALSAEAQSRLSSAKALLDAMKIAAEQDKADKEAEAAIVAEVNAFNESNANILAKTADNVTADDLDAIEKAIAEYNALSVEAQSRLINVKALLDAMKVAAEQDKAEKEAEAAIVAEVNAFNESNADILAKTADNVTADDLDAIEKAIAEYNALSAEAQSRLSSAKALLDAMKIAAEQDKADKEAEAAIVAEVNAFNESNADILAKTADNVTVDDLDAIEKAIAEYNALSAEAQSRLSSAKALLDMLKSKIDDLASGIASVTIDCAADEVYTLNGVRVRSIVKRGMYIVNGKKVLIK